MGYITPCSWVGLCVLFTIYKPFNNKCLGSSYALVPEAFTTSKEAQKRKNAAITPRRSRVEHVFGAIQHMKGDFVRCVGLTRSRIRIGLVNLVYNMLRLCQLTSLTLAALCPQH